jgi:hypothetical protein
MTASATQAMQSTLLVDRVVSHVTITEPTHPLSGRTLPIVRRSVSPQITPSVIVELPNGEHRCVAYTATDLVTRGVDGTTATRSLLPISARTLLPLAQAVRRLLGATEESPDEFQSPITSASVNDVSPRPDTVASPSATAPVAAPAIPATSTTGTVPGRTDPTPAPKHTQRHRGDTP